MAQPDFSQGEAGSSIDEELPDCLGRNARWLLSMNTDITTTASGAESRVGRWAVPREELDLGPGIKHMPEILELMHFWRAVRGPLDSFKFHHEKFHTSAGYAAGRPSAPAAITPLDQLIGIGDAATVAFQLVKNYASPGGVTVSENITLPKLATVRVAVGGVEQASPADFSVSAAGLITLTAPPGDGVEVRAGFAYYKAFRFDGDRLDFDQLVKFAGRVPVRLVEVKAG